MKKKNQDLKKLKLSKERIMSLTTYESGRIAGGTMTSGVILRTQLSKGCAPSPPPHRPSDCCSVTCDSNDSIV